MTSILQPLDRCINFSFKKYLKFKYVDFLLSEKKIKENIEESRLTIINDIICIWTGYKDNTNEYIGKQLV